MHNPRSPRLRLSLAFQALALSACWNSLFISPPHAIAAATEAMPLPEHPRPDFERPDWLNLNGAWEFRFDGDDVGERQGWSEGKEAFPKRITVPFPWGAELSGIEDEGDIAWYARTIVAPPAWRGQRVFLVIGACDWLTSGWLDGHALGRHRGGYTPFEFELTPHLALGKEQRLVLRVDDTPHSFKLEGKQGYGPAKGIWQTPYLEARPPAYLDLVHFLPDIDNGTVTVKARFSQPLRQGAELRLEFKTGDLPRFVKRLAAGLAEVKFTVPVTQLRLWSLDDPFLYEVETSLAADGATDRVSTYFGMRKIGVMNLPGTEFPYIALNNKPIYLQTTLDQSYHPEGFYTFPSDAFMRDEILRSKRIGLNGNRFHVKIDVPRKLYWADRLGLLVMADVPNSWGEPDAAMRMETEYALLSMLHRDFNHPSIFAWVPFNETWGLFTKQGDKRSYLPETQDWVASIYRWTKETDPTRLVEDNSPCNYDHVETDINSWHAYLPGYGWRDRLGEFTEKTFPGSKWNFIGGRSQSGQPMFNSECGNVWGYEGSAGDVDWSWDYHIMINEFRRQPMICGWLYTEHHDVINEWNGYYRFDRSEKVTGLNELVRGMSLRDLHSPLYISTGSELCRDAKPGERIEVPLHASFMTDVAPGRELVLRAQQFGWDSLGRPWAPGQETRQLAFKPWMNEELPPLKLKMPRGRGLLLIALQLETSAGFPLHRNFTTIRVTDGQTPRDQTHEFGKLRVRAIRFAPDTFEAAEWSRKQWSILDGLKINGAGAGYFEYRIPWPDGLEPKKVDGARFVAELSAKRLNGKDRDDSTDLQGNYMRGRGTHDPSRNPNSYPMTDTVKYPSAVRIGINGTMSGRFDLPDDPADHRGILSWHAQPRDRKLREAGSYGYLVNATIPAEALEAAAKSGEFRIRLEVDEALAGGLAIYGEHFGRYPVDPTLVFTLK